MTTWILDQAHSHIGFKARHVMISTVRGHFTEFEGTIEAPDDSFENASVRFSAKIDSIATANDMRDGHLKSADFFDAEQFPVLSFISTSFTKNGDTFEIIGDLTIKGVTKQIVLTGTFDGIGTNMQNARVAGFDVTGKINRQDFGLAWNKILETGSVVVGDEIMLDINVEAQEITS